MKKILVLLLGLVFLASFAACKGKSEQAGGGGEGELTPRMSQEAQMLEDALKDDPRNAAMLIKLGNLYYDWGQTDVDRKGDLAQPVDKWTKAIEYYRRSLDVDPKNVDVRVDMANLLRFLGRGDEAVTEYRTALSINPKHPQAMLNLVLALGQAKKDYKGAVAMYEELLKTDPTQKDNLSLKQEVDGYRELMKGAKK